MSHRHVPVEMVVTDGPTLVGKRITACAICHAVLKPSAVR